MHIINTVVQFTLSHQDRERKRENKLTTIACAYIAAHATKHTIRIHIRCKTTEKKYTRRMESNRANVPTAQQCDKRKRKRNIVAKCWKHTGVFHGTKNWNKSIRTKKRE